MKTIIIIDNNVDSLTVFKLLLTAQGYKVDCFSNWKKALNNISKIDPSLILIEVFLDTADGRNITKQLRSSEITKYYPVILTSNNKKSKYFVIDCGAQGFVLKPLQINSFLAKVNQVIENNLEVKGQ